MTQEADSNQNTVDDSVIYDTEFNFEENPTIEAVFEISPNVADLNYTFVQSVPTNIWQINHRLHKFPSVTVIDSAGTQVIPEIKYIDRDNVEIEFIGSFSGTAFLN